MEGACVTMSRLSVVLLMVYICLGTTCASGIGSLFEVETVFIDQLQSYIEKTQKKSDEIQRFLDYVDVLHDDIDATTDYYGNPINAFTTISRFVKNWQLEVIDAVLHNGGDLQYYEKLNKTLKENELEMPTQQDLLETTSNVMEYQEMSQTSTEDLVEGVFYLDPKTEKNVTMTASDCYVLGRNLHELKHYDSAAEWLLQARSLSLHEAETFPSVKQLDILKELAPSLMKLGNYKLARKLNSQILKAEPDNADALKNKPLLEGLLLLERVNKLSLKNVQEKIEENPELVG